MYPIYSFYRPGDPEPAVLYREEYAREQRKASRKGHRQEGQPDAGAEALRREHFVTAARFMRLS